MIFQRQPRSRFRDDKDPDRGRDFLCRCRIFIPQQNSSDLLPNTSVFMLLFFGLVSCDLLKKRNESMMKRTLPVRLMTPFFPILASLHLELTTSYFSCLSDFQVLEVETLTDLQDFHGFSLSPRQQTTVGQ